MRMVAVAVVRKHSANPRKRDCNLPRRPDRTDLGLRSISRKGRSYRRMSDATSACAFNVCRRCRAVYRYDAGDHGRTADLCARCFQIIVTMRREEWPKGWTRAEYWDHTYTIRVAKLYLRDYAEWKREGKNASTR